MNKVEIPLNKAKLLLGIGGSILFVILGVWLFTHANDFQNLSVRILKNPTLIKGLGIASILFFSATGIYGIRKSFDNQIGLIIDEQGIFDNTNASSVGLIKWTDITGIKNQQVASTKFLLIYTKNPHYYLDKVTGLKRKMLEGNNSMYGTPLSITSGTLKYNFSDLEKLIIDRLNKQRK
ncbi:STM3941 family protein [uncultured Spirosoma sp.]|uniref:STM3941 family protein n=1 Tax=uncultured Spirosoma sp. TaxID=278208 RepID=UPI002586A15A|nr:STM3941 family protein [uncultured Spirosoma sp.]